MKFSDKKIIRLMYQICDQTPGGFSLVEILIVLGILSITGLATTSLFTASQKNMQVLSEKFQIQNLNNSILTVLKNQSVCVANLTTGVAATDLSAATTTVASPNTINLNEIHYGQTAITPLVAKVGQSLPGVLPGKMVVQSIKIKNIMQTGNANEYKGSLVVEFDPATMSASLKPPMIDQVFTIGASPIAAAVVSGCSSAAAPTTGNCGPIGVSAPVVLCQNWIYSTNISVACNYPGDPGVVGLIPCPPGATHLSSGYPTQSAGQQCGTTTWNNPMASGPAVQSNGQSVGPGVSSGAICTNGVWTPTPPESATGGDGSDGN